MPTTIPQQSFRKEFSSRPYAYSSRMIAPQSNALAIARPTLDEAMMGVSLYEVGTIQGCITDDVVETTQHRLARYRYNWDFYNGDQYIVAFDEGEKKLVANFTEQVADIGANWMVAKGFTNVGPSGNELISELLNSVWEENDLLALMQSLAMFGAVTGDAYLYVTLQTRDEQGNRIPKEQQRIKLVPLNPAFVFPFWSPTKHKEMTRVLIQFPVPDPANETLQALLSLVIDAKTWTLYINDEKKSEGVNQFGTVNVIHFPNLPLANSSFGRSDIDSVIPLNEEYNTTINTIRRIVKYHGEPTTLIFGAKVGELERGSKKVWSGLPVDAKVENLKLDADLSALTNLLQEYKFLIAQFSGTPKVLFNHEMQAISNTSGLAMQMTFQPIVDKTRAKQGNWTRAIRKTNKCILLLCEKVFGMDIAALTDKPERRYETTPLFTSPLPRDEKSEVDVAQMKLNMKVWSRAEVQRRLAEVPDLSRLILEVAADERAELALGYETQQGNNGVAPNLSVVFLNSSLLSEDFEPLAEETPHTDDGVPDAEDSSTQNS